MTVADFSRQIKIIGAAGQAALAKARVLIAGAGGLGATAIPYLAAAGVGHLTIVDDDQVEASNLHRQIPFTYDDIGAPKAEKAAQFAQDRSPSGTFRAICRRLTPAEWLAEMQDHDLVLDCTDDRQLAYLLNDAAFLAGKPVIFANAAALNGQLFTLLPSEKTPCWRCLWPEEMPPTGNCNAIGVLAPAPATLGCWQALTALKWLAGMAVAADEMLYYDFAAMRQQVLKIAKTATCQHALDEATFLRRHDFIYTASLVEAKNAGMTILDIRRPEEWAAQPLAEADVTIEMTALLAEPERILQTERRYLLVCAVGGRAKHSAAQLRGRGYDNVFAFPKAW